jgi:chemotaxis protein methyltransferase CheR
LKLPDYAAYRSYLESYPEEWNTLASLCRVTISRFYRDRGVFDYISSTVMLRLAERADQSFRCWSAGCASGEEAYTIRILWDLRAAAVASGKTLDVIGTDLDPAMLVRARRALYPASALRDLPPELASQAFEQTGDSFILRPAFKTGVAFEEHDIRESVLQGPFDIILCRNLVFTYFEDALQVEILRELVPQLGESGTVVIGGHESLPAGQFGLEVAAPCIYRRAG